MTESRVMPGRIVPESSGAVITSSAMRKKAFDVPISSTYLRDAKGTLKASRIVQLRKVAMETGDDRFMEGVRIIEESYQPEVSKQFIRAEIKNENGMWKPIPLGMTES